MPPRSMKRKQGGGTQTETQKSKRTRTKRATQRNASSTDNVVSSTPNAFEDTLAQLGVQVPQLEGDIGDEREYIVVSEPHELSKKLQNALKDDSKSFVEGFERFSRSRLGLHAALSPTQSEGQQCDSLCRILLDVQCIQAQVLDILLQKLPEYIEDDSSRIQNSLPRLIINAFKWLDVVQDGPRLCENLFQTASVCPRDLKRELINAVPEIMPDPQHSKAAHQLKDMMDEDVELVAPVLDCLGSLTLPVSVLDEARKAVLDKLDSTAVQDLPVAVKFLIQSCGAAPDTALDIVKGLRSKLDFVVPQETPRKRRNETRRSGEALVLDALRTGMRVESAVAKAYLKEVDKNVIEPTEFKMIDVWILLSLCTLATTKKSAQQLLKRKASTGILKSDTVKSAIIGHSDGLLELFPAITSLAGSCLRKNDALVAEFGCALYNAGFQTFEEGWVRKELVVALVSHVGAMGEWEAGSALDVLQELAHHHRSKLSPYTAFVKSILECLGMLSDGLVRRALSVVLTLSGTEQANDVLIFIRKHVTSLESGYRRIGILGLGAIASTPSEGGASQSQVSQGAGLTGTVRWATDLLSDILDHYTNDSTTRAYLLDELDRAVSTGNVDASIARRLHEHVQSAVEDSHLADVQDGLLVPIANLNCGPLKPTLWGNLDKDLAVVAASILPNSSELTDGRNGGAISWRSSIVGGSAASLGHVIPVLYGLHLQPAALRLLMRMERHINGNLEYIDALLGCPLTLYEECVGTPGTKFNYLPVHLKDHVCVALVRAINWIRESINGYSMECSLEMQAKLLNRLQHLDELEWYLEQRLEEHPTFVDSLVTDIEPKAVKGKGKEGEEVKTTKASKCDRWARIRVDKARSQILRPLNPHTFGAMLMIPNTILRDSIHSTTVHSQMVTLLPEGLHHLLRDLLASLQGMATTTAAPWLKRRTSVFTPFGVDGPPLEVLQDIVPAVPLLCDRVSVIIGEIVGRDSRVADSDVDSPSVKDDDSMDDEVGVLNSCLVLTLQCLESMFSYQKLHSQEGLDALCLLMRGVINDQTEIAFTDLRASAFGLVHSWVSKLSRDIVWPAAAPVALCSLLDCMLGGSKWGSPAPASWHAAVSGGDDPTQAREKEAEMRAQLSEVAMEFLSRKWSTELNTEQVSALVHHAVYSARSPITKLADIENSQISAAVKDGEGVWPGLTKSSFNKYYKVVCAECGAAVLSVFAEHSRVKGLWEDNVIVDVSEGVQTIVGLISVTKSHDHRIVLASSLKLGKQFLEAFIKLMPVLSSNFRDSQDTIIAMLGKLQPGTRMLHNLCAHAKITEDASLMAMAPYVKRYLESILFKVKAMLDSNKCVSAFWLGNLRHRDLGGHEVSSQVDPEKPDEEAEEADEMSE